MSKKILLEALDCDLRGEWDKAHELAQSVEDTDGYWLHAYLHRKEGDNSNAAYWYSRAGKPVPGDSLEVEWGRLRDAFGG